MSLVLMFSMLVFITSLGLLVWMLESQRKERQQWVEERKNLIDTYVLERQGLLDRIMARDYQEYRILEPKTEMGRKEHVGYLTDEEEAKAFYSQFVGAE